ncbi:MAG: GH3 auxin-responsive promoter family protein [Planctomycetales bacterium]
MWEKLRSAVGAVTRARIRREARRFLATTVDCRAAQQRTLEGLLALNGDSRFSRERGLDRVRSVDDFRRALPVADYESFRPYIDEVKLGDHQALLGKANTLLMFSLTSGTTGESKFIPITSRFLADYRRGWQVWGIMCFDDHHPVNWKNVVQISSDYDRFRTPGGTPCGNISGLVSAMQKRIVRLMYTVPGVIAKIGDPFGKYYATLRLAVADGNVGTVTTANPSTLLQLARIADAEKETLIRDIADGTLSDRFPIDRSVREKLRWNTGWRRKARARELERIVETTGRLRPRDFWRGLEVLAVWCGGSCANYLPGLRELYGDVPVRDHGLHASEGRMTIPIADNTPQGILDVTTHFFEFIPEEEHGTQQPTVLEAHELEVGRNYYILMTTSSGLYRYDIRDVVRCTGFYGTVPVLEFLHKGAHISNITGEKIAESQIVAAIRRCGPDVPMRLREFTVAPVWSDTPYYEMLIESDRVVDAAERRRVTERLDRALQDLNCEYREKRITGRLGPLECRLVPPGTWARYARARQSRIGGSAEQYKHAYLVPEIDFGQRLMDQFGAPRVEEPVAARPHSHLRIVTGRNGAETAAHGRNGSDKVATHRANGHRKLG